MQSVANVHYRKSFDRNEGLSVDRHESGQENRLLDFIWVRLHGIGDGTSTKAVSHQDDLAFIVAQEIGKRLHKMRDVGDIVGHGLVVAVGGEVESSDHVTHRLQRCRNFVPAPASMPNAMDKNKMLRPHTISSFG